MSSRPALAASIVAIALVMAVAPIASLRSVTGPSPTPRPTCSRPRRPCAHAFGGRSGPVLPPPTVRPAPTIARRNPRRIRRPREAASQSPLGARTAGPCASTWPDPRLRRPDDPRAVRRLERPDDAQHHQAGREPDRRLPASAPGPGAVAERADAARVRAQRRRRPRLGRDAHAAGRRRLPRRGREHPAPGDAHGCQGDPRPAAPGRPARLERSPRLGDERLRGGRRPRARRAASA